MIFNISSAIWNEEAAVNNTNWTWQLNWPLNTYVIGLLTEHQLPDIYCWLDDVVENSRLLMTDIHISSAKRYFCFVFSFKLRLRPLRNELEDEIPDPSS